MQKFSIPGCWYLDSLPTGEHAGIIPQRRVVNTHQGEVPYPVDEPLWLAMTNKPVLRFMGQGHEGTGTWEWTEGIGWELREPSCGVWAVIYGPNGERHIAKCAPPTGSQGWRYYVWLTGELITGDATIAVVNGLNEWTDLTAVQDRSIMGGQGHEGQGACVWADGKLRLLHAGACYNTRWKYSLGLDIVSVSFYEVAPDGIQGWVYRMSMGELKSLPPVTASAPTFNFNHEVMVVPFKDPRGVSGAAAEIVANKTDQAVSRPYFVVEDSLIGTFFGTMLGVYTESTNPTTSIALAASHKTRLMICHDSQEPWRLPPGLRPWDIPVIELYQYGDDGRHTPETLEQAYARWRRDADAMLAAWSGDCAVCPQYYTMGGAKGGVPPPVWPVEAVVATHRYLEAIVNMSPRIKVITPFSYERANGITAYPELMTSFNALRQAAPGLVTLIPVGGEPIPPRPEPPRPIPPVPTPVPPGQALPMEPSMEPRSVAFALGVNFARVDRRPNLTPWPGWFPLVFDRRDASDPDSQFTIFIPAEGQPSGGGRWRADAANSGLLTMDFTEFGGSVCQGFYVSPADLGWGDYQQLDGWRYGPDGPEVLTKLYGGSRKGQVAPSLTVVPR